MSIVAEKSAVRSRRAGRLRYRIVVRRPTGSGPVRNQLRGSQSRLVRGRPREQQRGLLAVQIGEFRFQMHQRMMGAGDVAGLPPAPGPPGAQAPWRFRPWADTLDCWPIEVGSSWSPDHRRGLAFGAFGHTACGKPAGDPLEIGRNENPIACSPCRRLSAVLKNWRSSIATPGNAELPERKRLGSSLFRTFPV